VSTLAGARTTHRRRWSTAIAITRAVDMGSASKTILFRDFQMDHSRARMAVFRAFLCICDRSSERLSRRAGKSAPPWGRLEGETILHNGRRWGAANEQVRDAFCMPRAKWAVGGGYTVKAMQQRTRSGFLEA
jgi:hypothetical protein